MILHIDTSHEICSVALSIDNQCVAYDENQNKFDHAKILVSMIDGLLNKKDLEITQLSAISIAAGPGSYTGLRIGIATLKGMAHPLKIPIIGLNTLEVLTSMFLESIENQGHIPTDYLYAPMLDARRLEVYTTLLTHNFEAIQPTQPYILTDRGFLDETYLKPILYFGNGADKAQPYLEDKQPQSKYLQELATLHTTAKGQISLAIQRFRASNFENIYTFEPFYLKEFFTTAKKKE